MGIRTNIYRLLLGTMLPLKLVMIDYFPLITMFFQGLMSPSNIRSYAHGVSSTWPLKCKLSEDEDYNQAKLNGEKSHEVSTLHKIYRQVRKATNRRGGPPQGRRCNSFSNVKWSLLKTCIKNNIMGTQQVIFRDLQYIYVCNSNQWKKQ